MMTRDFNWPPTKDMHMAIVQVVKDDLMLSKRFCPACRARFLEGNEVFVSPDESVALHVTCVVAMALVASMRPLSEIELDEAFTQRRAELLERVRA